MKRRTPLRYLAASVRARLTERARQRNESVPLALTRYAIERLLFRLGNSLHRDRLVLKGATLFSLRTPALYRATGDLDLLASLESGRSLDRALNSRGDFFGTASLPVS